MQKQIAMPCLIIKIVPQISRSEVRLQRLPDPMSNLQHRTEIHPVHHSSVGTYKLEISRAVEHCEFPLWISTKLFGMGDLVTVIHWGSSYCAVALKFTLPPLVCRDLELRCI